MARNVLRKICVFIFPPLAFFIKDIIATMILLSTEPGITPRAAFYYSVALLPATLVVRAGQAIFVNILVGFLVGGVFFLLINRQAVGRPWRDAPTELKPSALSINK